MALDILFPNGQVLSVLTYIDDPIKGIIPWDGTIAVTIPPPTGGATAANQVLEIADLDAIKASTANIPVLGQALVTTSVPVVLPVSQITTLTPPAAITGFALESGGNLASIKADTDKIPALGQALAAGSVPVVLTAVQQSALTPPAAITGFALETGGNLAEIATDTDHLDTNLSVLDTDIKQVSTDIKNNIATLPLPTGAAADATLLAIESRQPSTLLLDGQTTAFATDFISRRIAEADYLVNMVENINGILATESDNSQRIGFELR